MKSPWGILAGILAAALGGCGKPPDRAAPPTVALVMKSLANEFFQGMQDGAIRHQAARPDRYALLVNGIKDEQDVSRQVQLVEQMTAQGCRAIVLAPADSKALIGACKRAQDAGAVVVNIDNRLSAEELRERGLKIPFVGPDNRAGARQAGAYLARRLKARDKVALLEGAPGAYNGGQRKLGFEDAMNEAGLQIVSSQSGHWESDRANRIVSALLIEQPDLKALLCCNDSMALGAVAALKSAGRSDQVQVVGFDNITAVRQLIREGKVLCTVDQHGDQLAVYGIEAALDFLGTKEAPQDRQTPVDLVTAETLK